MCLFGAIKLHDCLIMNKEDGKQTKRRGPYGRKIIQQDQNVDSTCMQSVWGDDVYNENESEVYNEDESENSIPKYEESNHVIPKKIMKQYETEIWLGPSSSNSTNTKPKLQHMHINIEDAEVRFFA